jgi:hypothetical protein
MIFEIVKMNQNEPKMNQNEPSFIPFSFFLMNQNEPNLFFLVENNIKSGKYSKYSKY